MWKGHYKFTIVDAGDYLLLVYRYIELNSVRAKMVRRASEYSWSSFQSNALGKPIRLLAPHTSYRMLGKDEANWQRADLDEADPVLGSFLSFLASDIQANLERLKAATPELVSRIQNLVGGIEVNLDAPRDDEDE